LIALILVGCSMSGAMMSTTAFYDVPIGATSDELKAKVGAPNQVYKLDDGSMEYEYVEREKAGVRTIQERHYFFVIKDGKVVSKRMKQGSPPAFLFDSYEMQTTQTN
jgi:hypothetical protein